MPWPVCSLASFLGGFCAGVINNPIDIVYNRQAADALLPDNLKKQYRGFFDGLTKIHMEGSLMRGAVASGLASGALLASMSNFYDFLKEYFYWFFGPTSWLRPLILVPTAALGTLCYLPFDNIKVRLHNMTALPDGELPYKGVYDAFSKVKYKIF
jgi:solute carrier family 25 (mitochondrial oxoglutarate transporter), member 11